MILILGISIYMIIGTVKARNKILIGSKSSRTSNLLIFFIIVIFYVLAYRLYLKINDITVYLLTTALSIYFYLSITSSGLSKDGIVYLTSGKSLKAVQEVAYDEFRIIEYREGKDIEIYGQNKYGYINMKFDLENREEVLGLLRDKKAFRLKI